MIVPMSFTFILIFCFTRKNFGKTKGGRGFFRQLAKTFLLTKLRTFVVDLHYFHCNQSNKDMKELFRVVCFNSLAFFFSLMGPPSSVVKLYSV